MNYQKLVEKNMPSASLGQELRAVGQGLESLDVEDFDLQAEGDGYFALGIPRAQGDVADAASRPKQGSLKDTLQNAWQSFTGRIDNTGKASKTTSHVLRILFTPEGIQRLEREGKAKRSEDSAGIPNLYKLAHILRMVGVSISTRNRAACSKPTSGTTGFRLNMKLLGTSVSRKNGNSCSSMNFG